MWDNTQAAASTEEEAAALELSDFLTMEEIRRRVDEIVEDPETAEKLKPGTGQELQAGLLPRRVPAGVQQAQRDTSSTPTAGASTASPRRAWWSTASSTRSTAWCSPRASRSTPTTSSGSGFDPVGRGGQAMSERWSDGAHTLHGVLQGDFPNLMLISLVQAGFGTNFVHFLAGSAAHCACDRRHLQGAGHRDHRGHARGRGGLADDALRRRRRPGRVRRPSARRASTTPSCRSPTRRPPATSSTPAASSTTLGHLERWRAEGQLAGTVTTKA